MTTPDSATSPRTLAPHWLGIAGIVLLMGILTALRVWQPCVFHWSGSDIPIHIAAPMSLDPALTHLSTLPNAIRHIVAFHHGYSQITGLYALYKLVFGVLGVPINEFSLAAVHSIVGMLSLVAAFFFVRSFAGTRTAVFFAVLLGLAPIHVALSAANSGYQLFKMAGIYFSLFRLYRWHQTPTRANLVIYAGALFFAIGAGTDFFLTVLLNILFAVLLSRSGRFPGAAGLPLWKTGWIVILAWLPCLALLAEGAYSWATGTPMGVLSHSAHTTLRKPHGFEPQVVLTSLFWMVGPFALISLPALLTARVWRNPWGAVLATQWIVEFLVLAFSDRANWTSHIVNLAVPSLALACFFLQPFRWRHPLMIAGALSALLFTLSIVFRIGTLSERKTYGTRYYEETGIQALGCLVRQGLLPVERNPRTEKLGLAIAFEGAWFYLGADTLDTIDFDRGAGQSYRSIYYVIQPNLKSPKNKALDAQVSGMPVVAEIVDHDRVLMRIFGPTTNTTPHRLENSVLKSDFYRHYRRPSDFRFNFL